MNCWGIPAWLEEEVKKRDRVCVYCGVQMIEKMSPNGSKKAVATWEHIINDASIVNRENIARCCRGCNSSKGTKRLSEWLQSSYCIKRGITRDTVATVVKNALRQEQNDSSVKISFRWQVPVYAKASAFACGYGGQRSQKPGRIFDSAMGEGGIYMPGRGAGF